MNKYFGLVLVCFVMMLAGCATCDTNRLDNIDARVKALESNTGKSDRTQESSTEKSAMTSSEATATVAAPDSPTKADVQACLKNAGYYDGVVDGKLGPKTKKSIQDFQTANELNADGKVGPNTWNKLKKFYTGPTESK